MALFAAILYMEKPELNDQYRPQHLAYLANLESEGKVHAKGPFIDGAGGMVIYEAESLQEATQLAEADPYVIEGVRRLELHEWKKA
ncbi:YciI family protein [Halalkalibacter urbisdiaboli]|uniref:YciI family protein n=1 Tax=Halalkalibacter urbisdiaboli TaxID=1960589 RepID=UPI000B44A53A|nr:YciI family protein [Halalkalibacter urbisdiaboli]